MKTQKIPTKIVPEKSNVSEQFFVECKRTKKRTEAEYQITIPKYKQISQNTKK